MSQARTSDVFDFLGQIRKAQPQVCQGRFLQPAAHKERQIPNESPRRCVPENDSHVQIRTSSFRAIPAVRSLNAHHSRFDHVRDLLNIARHLTHEHLMPLVLLDRDGVINVDSRATSRTFRMWLPIDGSLAAIAPNRAGSTVAICSNQSGVARGILSIEDLETFTTRCESGWPTRADTSMRSTAALTDRTNDVIVESLLRGS
jgi:hypothetical protein